MSDLSSSELERTARAYEKLLVPALFRAWADQMVSAAGLQSSDSVLDVACGTGVLSRAIKRHLGPGGSVTGLDLNSGMLAVAREQAGDIVWREGNAEALPFNDHSFDAVMSQFGLMLFESPAQALREMWRVLRPGGGLLVAVFDSLDQVPAYAAAANVYEQVVDPSVGNALRFPFSMGDPDELRALFEQAGIPQTRVITRRGAAHFDDVHHMVLSDVKGWFPFAGIQLDDETIDEVERRMTSELRPYIRPTGEVHFDVSIQTVAAAKPENEDWRIPLDTMP